MMTIGHVVSESARHPIGFDIWLTGIFTFCTTTYIARNTLVEPQTNMSEGERPSVDFSRHDFQIWGITWQVHKVVPRKPSENARNVPTVLTYIAKDVLSYSVGVHEV